MTVEKLYLVTRRTLPLGAQAAQLCHAMRQFAHEWPDKERAWFTTSNTVSLLAAYDEKELMVLCDLACDRDVPFSRFFEPDLGNALTAIALLGKRAASVVRSLPLAFT